jgi:hypothetical protein
MSRNRKHQAAALRFGPAVKALSLCLFLAGSGVGYVWQKDQIYTLSDRLKQCEVRYDRLRRENDRLSRVLAELQSPAGLELRIRQIDLGLVAAQPNQIVHLIEAPPAREASAGSREQLYADQRIRSWLQR